MTFPILPDSVQGREREARAMTRELLWQIWRRFSGIDDVVAPEEARAHMSTIGFEDFLIANTDIVERVVDACRQKPGVAGMDVMMEIEKRASRGLWR